MTGYKVNARRSGDWWALEVPDLPGVFSQTKRLDKAPDAAREAIAVMLDIAPSDVQVSVQPVLPTEVRAVVQDALKARAAAERAPAVNQQAARVLTKDLGLSLRDAGAIMGLSFQRVAQLLGPSRRSKGGSPTDGPGSRAHA